MGNTEAAPVSYEGQLVEEAKTWCIEDDARRQEKLQRERMRHPKLIRDLLLDQLDTHLMYVLEVGGGPSPVSDLLQFDGRMVVDPCADEYAKFFPVPDHHGLRVEEMGDEFNETFDLVICTNALDHVEDPETAVERIGAMCKPGGWVAVMCAENNALTNPHPCHAINLTAEQIHQWTDRDFETVWELTFRKDNYRYGWVEYQGKRGQPAFALLLRKCAGY